MVNGGHPERISGLDSLSLDLQVFNAPCPVISSMARRWTPGALDLLIRLRRAGHGLERIARNFPGRD